MNERTQALIATLDALATQQAVMQSLVDSLKGFAVRPAASAPAADKVQAAVLRMNLADIEQALGTPAQLQQTLDDLQEFNDAFLLS